MQRQLRVSVIFILLPVLFLVIFIATVHARRTWFQPNNVWMKAERACIDGVDFGFAVDDSFANDYPFINVTGSIWPNGERILNGYTYDEHVIPIIYNEIPIEIPHSYYPYNPSHLFHYYNTKELRWKDMETGEYKILQPGQRVRIYKNGISSSVFEIENCTLDSNMEATSAYRPAISFDFEKNTNPTLISKIDVPDHIMIRDINFGMAFRVSNPSNDSIHATLRSPKGTVVNLFTIKTNVLGRDSNMFEEQECGLQGHGYFTPVQFYLDDDSSFTIEEASEDDSHYIFTTFRPQGPGKLEDFVGEIAKGTWTLELTIDNVYGFGPSEFCWYLDMNAVNVTFLPVISLNHTSAPDLVVNDIIVSNETIQVTIGNIGTQAITLQDSFWVDLYIDPTPPPTEVNHIWQDGRSQYGLVWGVVDAKIDKGETLTLTTNDQYFRPELSHLPNMALTGTTIYAQVDSANVLTNYGAVMESHEISEEQYNNITGVSIP